MLFIVNNIIKSFIPLCLFVWAIFMPKAGGYTFVGLYVVFQIYLFTIDRFKPDPDPIEWSIDERNVIRKYHLALRFPFGANIMSSQLNGFRWIGLFLFTPLLLWHHMWLAAAVNFVSFFITGSISVRLDPFFFLGDAVRRGKRQFEDELIILKQVSDRLNDKMKQRIVSNQ